MLSSSEFNSYDSPASVGATGDIEVVMQQPKRRRVAVLTSALPLKQASSQEGDKKHGLMISKRIEKGDTAWYIFSDSKSNAYPSRCVTHYWQRLRLQRKAH